MLKIRNIVTAFFAYEGRIRLQIPINQLQVFGMFFMTLVTIKLLRQHHLNFWTRYFKLSTIKKSAVADNAVNAGITFLMSCKETAVLKKILVMEILSKTFILTVWGKLPQ